MKTCRARIQLLASMAIVTVGLNGIAQIPQLLTPMKPDDATPVIIEWESDPAGIYSVEYSVGLTGDWSIVEQDFPSQGGTTRWTDRGNPDSAEFRHSSADPWAPHRFYRVRFDEFMDTNNGPITVTVTNISSGSGLSGVVEVLGTVTASQRIASVRLLVDGFVVAKARGPEFSLPFESREFANGTHRLSVVAQDGGSLESTEEVNELGDEGAGYGVVNIPVSFTNFIYNVRLRFEHFMPEVGDTQAVFASWISPRDWQLDVTDLQGSVVHRTFSGAGRKIEVYWDGMDTNQTYLDPQLLAYRFTDLGEAVQQSSPAMDRAGVDAAGNLYPTSAEQAVLAGVSYYYVEPPPLPPPLEELFGPLPPHQVIVSDEEKQQILVGMSPDAIEEAGDGVLEAAQGEVFTLNAPYGIIATFGVAGQGHHPAFGNYPPPSRLFGGPVRMSSQNEFGPWGGLKSPRIIAAEASRLFSKMGYPSGFRRLDDDIVGDEIRRQGFGNTNIFNFVTVGLYIGHSAAGRDLQSGLFHLQSYVPIYSSGTDSMDWVGASEMEFGSPVLKWMAFYSCNLLRDGLYRSDGIYLNMKDHFALPMNGYLHILQAYATEMRVHSDMAFYWTTALRGSPLASPADRTVVGAWNYVCRNTQWNPTHPDPDVNVARSIYWPECAGDFIYGYGPQTEPNRDPNDPTEQFDLEETDQIASSPGP